MTQKTGIYKPFVKDGELWGSQINKKRKCKCKLFTQKFEDCPHINESLTSCSVFDKWQQAEQSLQSFKVDEGEYQIIDGDFFSKTYKDGREKWVATLLTEVIQFKATIKDNTLINLEVL